MATHLKNAFQFFWDQYESSLAISDERVADWPLMSDIWATMAITAAYIFIVLIGPKLMEDRKAFEFPLTLFLYNVLLVVLNFHITYELLSASWKLNYSYSCQKVSYTRDPDEMRIASALWWYYISKMVEFLDTIFFILRKKNNQVTFLHVYHHATMFPLWFIGVKWVAGGQSFFGALINSLVHVAMYTYYALAALGRTYQKYLWWKKYLTILQLVQFVVGLAHAAQSLYIGCLFPTWMQWGLIFYAFSIFVLFLNFYFHAYVHPVEQNMHDNGDLYAGQLAGNGTKKHP